MGMTNTKTHTTGRVNVRNGAQGVIVWDRKLEGRWFRFSLVTAGWWGVGETGTVRVKAQHSGYAGGDYYLVRTDRLSL
jgi:hypothetical protein